MHSFSVMCIFSFILLSSSELSEKCYKKATTVICLKYYTRKAKEYVQKLKPYFDQVKHNLFFKYYYNKFI